MRNSNEANHKELRRARITALIYSALAIFSLLMLVYAFIQRTQAETLAQRVAQLEMELDTCRAQISHDKQNN